MKKVLLVAVPLLLVLGAAAYLLPQHLDGGRSPQLVVKRDTPYRLQPDRRFLLAVSEVARLLAEIEGGWLPSRPEGTRAEFAANGWQIYYGSEMAGTLREFPDFDEAMELLTQWAAKRAKADDLALNPVRGRQSVAEAGLSRLDVVAAAKAIDEEWKANGPDADLVREAARTSVLFAALPDQTGLGDIISARALAWLAVSGAIAPPDLTREACLLACLMDYTGSAYKLSNRLAVDDPVRYFARRQEKELASLASKRPEDREVRLLWLLALGRHRSTAEWAAYFTDRRDVFTASLLEVGTGLPLRSLDTDLLVTTAVLSSVSRELLPLAPPSKMSRLPELEARIDEACSGLDGPLLDQKLLQTYFRTASYSALHLAGYHELEIFSSVESSQAFAKSLAEEGIPPLADDFRQWYQVLADNKAGTPNKPRMNDLLRSDSPFGTPLRSMVYQALLEGSEYGSHTIRLQALGFVEHLDTRLQDRVKAAQLARDPLWALTFCESLWASIAECAGPAQPSLVASQASLVGDQARLEAVLNDSSMTPLEKASLLEFLAGNDFNDAVVEPQLKALCRASRQWDVLSQYIDFLMKRKRFRDVVTAIEAWLPTGETEHALDMTVARTRLAAAYEALGQFETGLRKLEDESVDQWQGGAMYQRARLLGRLGRWEEALRLAGDMRGRYPDGVMSLLSEVLLLWRKGEYEKAASELAGWPYPMNAGTWRWTIGPRFAECFRDNPHGAIEAAAALIRMHKLQPEMIYQLSFEVGASRPEVTHEILSRIPTQGLRRLETLTLAYKYLKQVRGVDKAQEWMRQRLSEDEKLPLCIFAHEMKVDELLWDMAPKEIAGEEGECYWLLRAAGNLIRPVSAERTSLLEEHFAGAGTSHYHALGRYLFNQESQAAVLALMTDPKKKCEAYYYLGLKEQAAGRYNQAADFYLQCIDTGLHEVTECRWAHNQLVLWRGHWKTLARLAQQERDSRGHL